MKTMLVAACFFMLGWKAVGQVDYNKIILPDDATNVSFEERLVQLAWRNNPESQMANDGVAVAREEGKASVRQWSTLTGVTGNLNEFSIKRWTDPSATPNQFYPRYNIFVQLPLSLLVQTPHIRKAAQAKTAVAEGHVNLTKLALRARVLKLYNDYKNTELILAIRRQSADDEDTNFRLMEQKFKNGEVMVDEFMKVQRGRNELKILVAQADNDYRKAKLDLEEVIGMRVEDVK